AGFFFPFFGCAAAAYFLLGWNPMASWLGGVALSTTSVAGAYAVMLGSGLNKTEYGKTVLAAGFTNDFGPRVALGFILAPFHPGGVDLRRRRGRGVRHSAVAYAEILQALWQAAVGARNQVSPALSVRPRCPCHLGR